MRKSKIKKTNSSSGIVIAIVSVLFLMAAVGYGIYSFSTSAVTYTCTVTRGKNVDFMCKDSAGQIIDPEQIFAKSEMQKYKAGNGLVVNFVTEDGAVVNEFKLEEVSGFNYDQKGRRNQVTLAETTFSEMLGKVRNPEAKLRELVILADTTDGVNSQFRQKLQASLKDQARPVLKKGDHMRVRMYLLTDKDNVQPTSMDVTLSSETGGQKLNLEEYLPNHGQLKSSSLTLGVWNLFAQLQQGKEKIQVLVYSDLQENDPRVAVFNPQIRAKLKDEVEGLVQKAAAIQPPPTVDDKVEKVVVVAIPGTNSDQYRAVKPFWDRVFSSCGINNPAYLL